MVFNTLGLDAIWAQTRIENVASTIMMKKMSFRLEGTLRRHRRIAGQWIDTYQVGLLEENFKPHC